MDKNKKSKLSQCDDIVVNNNNTTATMATSLSLAVLFFVSLPHRENATSIRLDICMANSIWHMGYSVWQQQLRQQTNRHSICQVRCMVNICDLRNIFCPLLPKNAHKHSTQDRKYQTKLLLILSNGPRETLPINWRGNSWLSRDGKQVTIHLR